MHSCPEGLCWLNHQDHECLTQILVVWYRNISCRVAMAVITMAYEEGHLHNPKAVAALKAGDDELEDWVVDHQYLPEYRTMIELPRGVLE